MAISDKLKQMLESAGAEYEICRHPLRYTSTETAASQHVPGKQFIKPVIISADGNYYMCVLNAQQLIDFENLKEHLSCEEVRLAKEEEIANLFPDYEVGAEPPFGMDNLPVLADSEIESNHDICFNAGTHTDTIKIPFSQYARIAKPTYLRFGRHI